MCLKIRNTKESRTLWVANEDITCYKVLDVWGKQIISPYQSFKYKIGKLYKAKLKVAPVDKIDGIHRFKGNDKWTDDTIIDFIYKGLHSYTSLKALNKRQYYNFFGYNTFKCIIPKGSEFYIDPIRGEYVSNQIIIVKEIK